MSGPQGGDPRHRPTGVRIDLSTCVSRYGPAPAALAALRTAPPPLLRDHPYGADEQLAAAYAAHLGVPAAELVVGRGASGLIWQLAASPLAERVAVPLPAYTEYHRAFPGATSGPPALHHRLERVADLLAAGRVVMLANPHNPSGRAFPADQLAEVAACGESAGGVLVVDESYVEFVAEPSRVTLVGRDLDGVVVLRSPSKFFGVAGARVAVAWSRRASLRDALRPRHGSWPVSALEVVAVAAALADRAWATAVHASLRHDAAWLGTALRLLGPTAAAADVGGRPTKGVVPGSVTHFRLLVRPDAARVHAVLAECGVGSRLLGRGHGLPGAALRVAAPRPDERDDVARAIAAAGRGCGGAACPTG